MSVSRDALGRETIADFGDQWTTYVDNSGYYGSPELFNDVFAPFLTVEAVAGKVVADIGAGTGRFVNILLAGGARQVTAVEPSDAVDVLRRNIPPQAEARVDVIHATGDRLPGTDHFDYVFSIGVLHHIPEPGPVCRASLRALRPGGVMAIWLYGREGNTAYLAIFGPLRAITRRLPHAMLAGLVWIMGWGLDAYVAAAAILPLPLRGYARRVLAPLTRDKRRLVIYDQLNPAYAKYYRRGEAEALLRDAGLVNIRSHHRHGYSWTVIGGETAVTVFAVEHAPPVAPVSRLVSIVAPVYNEAATLPEFVRRIAAACAPLEGPYRFEFLVVDDGSTDETLRLAIALTERERRLRVIQLRRNFGQTAALQAGLAAAAGDVIISMDSDLQHFPEDIAAFLTKLDEGYDLVCGWRHERKEGIVRRWPSRVANLLIRRICGIQIHDFGTTFRCYRRDLVSHLRLLGEQHRFVPALAELVGARVTEIKIQNIERPVGKSNYGLGRTLNVALDILFLYFSRRYFTRPLKAFGKIAMLLAAGGGAIAAILLGDAYWTGTPTVREHSGWFILSMLLLLAGLQIMLTGILAEIIVRIYFRLDQSEGYVVRQTWGGGA